MTKNSPGVFIIRHGARTSSSIGRKEDYLLNKNRKGLTLYGYAQAFLKGRNIIQNIIKDTNINKNGNIILRINLKNKKLLLVYCQPIVPELI